MAQQDRSVIDDSQHSEICSGHSLHRVMRFDELDVHDDVALSDGAKSTELIADSLHHERSIYDNVSRATEQVVVDKLSELEAKTSSTDAVVESRYRDSRMSSDSHHGTPHWHSTPSVHCHKNLSPSRAVSGGQMQNCEADFNAASSVVTVGHCDQQTVFTVGSPLHCHVSTTADDGNTSILVNSTSPDCKTVQDNDNSGASAERHSRNVALIAAAVTGCEELNGDKELTDCRPAADLKDDQRPQSQTTESVCQELSEMMRECVINDDTGKQVNGDVASDADVSDSFDLDVAAKDLERAVSAGMLDFLLESYEDSDEDVSSEQMPEELDELSLSDDDDDDGDDDDDDDSESTLTDSQAGGSDDSVIDDDDHDDDDDDDNVLRRHERIRQRMYNDAVAADNDDDDDDDGSDDSHEDSAANVDPSPADLELVTGINDSGSNHNTKVKDAINSVASEAAIAAADDDDDDDNNGSDNNYEDSAANIALSTAQLELVTGVNCDDDNRSTEVNDINNVVATDDDDDDDDDNVLKRHQRIRRRMKRTGNVDDNCEHSSANVGPADVELVTGIIYNDGDHNTEVNDVNYVAASECRERAKPCLNYGDRDGGNSHAAIAAVVEIYTHNVDDDDNYDDADVLTEHERVNWLLKDTSSAATNDDSFRTGDAYLANVNVNCSCMDDDNASSVHLTNAKDIDYSSPSGGDSADANCTDNADLAVNSDRVSMSEKCMPLIDNQLVLCSGVESMSPAVEYSRHNVLDKLDGETVPACSAEPAVSPGICSSCTQLPGDVQNADTDCNLSTETSLSLNDLWAGTTSTPSTCSHHSQTHQTVIDWREGVYTGLCRHSDGSEIRKLCVTS